MRWTPRSRRTATQAFSEEWPDRPCLRFLVYRVLRRDKLCDPGLCPDAPDEDGQRCKRCPLDRLDAAQCREKGLLIRRALDLMGTPKLAVQIGLDEIRGRVWRNADHCGGAGSVGAREAVGYRNR